MKKRIVLCLLMGCLMTAFAGCASAEEKEVVSGETETDEEEEDDSRSEAEEEDSKKDKEDDKDSSDEEEKEDKKEKKSSKGPVLGGDDVEGYEGFEYLYEELLMTETEENKKTGKKERKSLTVYIPDDEYSRADGSYAYSNSMGINFRVELQPYIRYDAEDYLPQENLDEYINNKYDPFYTADYKDLVINAAEEVGEDAVVSTVEYCRYNEWEEEYYSVFCTYYLAVLENEETVLVAVEVADNATTGKTELVIEELEQFYQFDINWDAGRAEQKRVAYAANETENAFSTGTLLFELPMGWEEDNDISSYQERVYAPSGDSVLAECLIVIGEEYLGFNESVDFDSIIENFEEDMGDLVTENAVQQSAEKCETNLGSGAKLVYEIEDYTLVAYVIEADNYVYSMMALQSENATDDAIAVLESVIENGQLR